MAPLNADGRFVFHVMGPVRPALRALPHVVQHGPYPRPSFIDVAERIAPHFGVVLSIWPETWCHTLTEMWAAGLPVAGFDLGAVGERLRRHGGGWLLPVEGAAATFPALERIASDAAGFAAKTAALAEWQATEGRRRSCAHMADDYDALFRALMARAEPPPARRAPPA
jgi:hypothetical protein